MNTNNEIVKVDCFYYSFYIKKSELSKYNIDSNYLTEKTNKIINDARLNTHYKIDINITEDLLQKNGTRLNSTRLNNYSNILYKFKRLEQLNLYYLAFIYYLLFIYRKIKY